MNIQVDPIKIKAESEKIISDFGGKICDWLPHLDDEIRDVRTSEEIVSRALILNAILNIYFKAPVLIIRKWIHEHGLDQYLTIKEKELLELDNGQLTEQQLIDIYWNIESLWALMWVGNLINDMPFDRCIDDHMASLCPNLAQGEGPEKFSKEMKIRSNLDIYRMLDLYFRLHWWTRDAQLNGYSSEPVSIDIVMERRKALEWVMDPEAKWDDVPLNT